MALSRSSPLLGSINGNKSILTDTSVIISTSGGDRTWVTVTMKYPIVCRDVQNTGWILSTLHMLHLRLLHPHSHRIKRMENFSWQMFWKYHLQHVVRRWDDLVFSNSDQGRFSMLKSTQKNNELGDNFPTSIPFLTELIWTSHTTRLCELFCLVEIVGFFEPLMHIFRTTKDMLESTLKLSSPITASTSEYKGWKLCMC